ncbi:MAG: DUF177 domain-containing protein [Firmicutes bacterium]|nr:DUF177 domain-containing protein [Bacillota bacterium]
MVVRINIHAIKFNKANELKGTVEANVGELDLAYEEVQWQEPVIISYQVTNAGDLYLFEARVQFSYSIACSRCLAPIEEKKELTVQEQFGRRTDQSNPSEDIQAVTGDEIDVTDSIRDQILLTMPAKPLCKQDCAGLCPQCGGDRNRVACDCREDNIDPRLAALGKLLK